MITIKLSAPIMAHNEKYHVLELREPTFDEVEKFGFPFTINSDGGFKVDTSAVFKYLPILAGIPRSSAAKLALNDLFSISMRMMSFFTSSERETDSDPDSTTSPTSGE